MLKTEKMLRERMNEKEEKNTKKGERRVSGGKGDTKTIFSTPPLPVAIHQYLLITLSFFLHNFPSCGKAPIYNLYFPVSLDILFFSHFLHFF
jgi:hypothetical protein